MPEPLAPELDAALAELRQAVVAAASGAIVQVKIRKTRDGHVEGRIEITVTQTVAVRNGNSEGGEP